MSSTRNSTFQDISKSQLNHSVSKAMYTIPKAQRFQQLKQKSSSSFYQIPSTLHSRSTSFGYGTKSQLVNKYNLAPSPDKYEKKSQFQPNPKRGQSFGLGRSQCKNVSIFTTYKTPAPTDYRVEDDKENSKTYTIGARVKLPALFPDKKTPGPGAYTSQSILKNGISLNSKYRSRISFKISQSTSKSIKPKDTPILGPLTYNTAMGSTGKQILSKKRTQKSFVFDKNPRNTIDVGPNIPGPGAYSFHSEFSR